MSKLQSDFVRWLGFHVLAIACFVAAAQGLADLTASSLTDRWGSLWHSYAIMASGAWGSWMFMGAAQTNTMRRVAKFTVLVPGLAMLGMTARAFLLDFHPDRWVQWGLAGVLSVVLAWNSGTPRRSASSHPWLFILGGAVAAIALANWHTAIQVAGDVTLGHWWNAPIVATLTAVVIPRLLAEPTHGSEVRDPELGGGGDEVGIE